jgi:two-component system, response regulator PdtaR
MAIRHNPRMSLPTEATDPPAGVRGKGRVLVVDDDRLVLATVTHGLQQAGYEIIDADNGDDAILLARQHRPDLALLDIRMEGKSGFDVAATLRDAYRIPFMFLSAFSDPATLAQVEALGALAYLVKPLDVGQIVPAVEAAFVRLRGQAAGVSPLPIAASVPAPAPATTPAAAAPASPWSDPLALAVGVLMHRHALTREQAWDRLQRLAQAQQHSPLVQAERLLGAVEELARSAL